MYKTWLRIFFFIGSCSRQVCIWTWNNLKTLNSYPIQIVPYSNCTLRKNRLRNTYYISSLQNIFWILLSRVEKTVRKGIWFLSPKQRLGKIGQLTKFAFSLWTKCLKEEITFVSRDPVFQYLVFAKVSRIIQPKDSIAVVKYV